MKDCSNGAFPASKRTVGRVLPLASVELPVQKRWIWYLSPSTRKRSPGGAREASRARRMSVAVSKTATAAMMERMIVEARTESHSPTVRRVSARPVRRSSSSCLPH